MSEPVIMWACCLVTKSCLLLLLLSCFSRVRLCATPWTAAYQTPLPMGFSRQEYWSGLPLPSPSHVWLFANSWTAAHQAFLSFTISRSLLKLMSMSPWDHPTTLSSVVPFFSCLQAFFSIRVFSNDLAFCIMWPSIRVSILASIFQWIF